MRAKNAADASLSSAGTMVWFSSIATVRPLVGTRTFNFLKLCDHAVGTRRWSSSNQSV